MNETTEKPVIGESPYHKVLLSLLAVMIVVTAFNQYQIATIQSMPVAAAPQSYGGSSNPVTEAQPSSQASFSSKVIPKGIPSVYGSELGISYDDVSPVSPALADQTIRKLAAYDTDITLDGEDLDRYIVIGLSISCEYCCGAKSIIFPNGAAACGCAHSYAMRGLAKYLIQNHGEEFSDEQIVEELGKWKVLFFPGIHEEKAAALLSQDIDVNYINLASNKYRGIEQGTGGSMVGGC